jgi:cell division protein FtsB
MRIVGAILILLLLLLQSKAWFSDVGHRAANALLAQVEEQRARADRLEQRNRLLTAEVLALKDGLAAVESRARSDLGMVKKGETFFLMTESE